MCFEGGGNPEALTEAGDRAIAALIDSFVAQLAAQGGKWLKFTQAIQEAIALADGPGRARISYIKRVRYYMPPGTYYIRLCHDQAVGFLDEADVRHVVEECRKSTGKTLRWCYAPDQSIGADVD